MPEPSSLSGGQLVVSTLASLGTERVFCVPGESYLPVLDALYDSDITTTVCRHESGAAMMAEATAKLSGQPGICFVTRGPGATNASAGIHIAAQDSTPVILFVGQISRHDRYREVFQEVDYRQFFGGMAKWVAEVDEASRLQEIILRAWHTAINGRPGPVVIVLPEETLTDAATPVRVPPIHATHNGLSATQIANFTSALAQAKRPIAIVGGSRWSPSSVTAFQQFALQLGLPVACAFRRQMLFDHQHPCYAGDLGLGANPALCERVRESDLVVLVGTRLSDIASQGHTLLNLPVPQQSVVHIHPGDSETGSLYQPALAIHTTPVGLSDYLETLVKDLPADSDKQQQAAQAHEQYLAWSSLDQSHPDGALMREVMEQLAQTIPNAIITNGAGNYASWIHRFWRFRHYGTQVAPTSGSMGYGLPAGIAAKLAVPEQPVITFAGDGCFQMTGQELATAVQYHIGVVVLVIDNGMYGTIRMHQEKHYPGRVSATDIVNPDFAALARSYGAYGATVTQPGEFASALTEACQHTQHVVPEHRTPALIHIKTNPAVITPVTVL